MYELFKKNHSLKAHTTFGIGGACDFFFEVDSIELMQKTIQFCFHNKLSYFILGKGSNVLFDDRGYKGLVILNRIAFVNELSPYQWRVGSGYSFSLLGTQTARKGLSGLEFASGIPGSVGGAVYMNAGANGRETCDALEAVDFMDDEGHLKTLLKRDLQFDYRFSSFQNLKGSIVSATFKLNSSNTARQKQLDIIHYRQSTQPYGAKSAGCVFRNPLQSSAGALIDRSGLKGLTVGGACVSEKHGNFIVNAGNASSQDVRELASLVKNQVKKHTGLSLECELRIVPYEEMK